MKQKSGALAYYVTEEIKKEIQSGHLEKIKKVKENCFVSPVVVTLKKTNQSKIPWPEEK